MTDSQIADKLMALAKELKTAGHLPIAGTLYFLSGLLSHRGSDGVREFFLAHCDPEAAIAALRSDRARSITASNAASLATAP